MKISIIIPVYNTDRIYLKKCLDSCLSQTIAEDVEVIAVNDGSTNGVESFLNEYGKLHKSLKVINQHNQGTSVARNAGIEASSGDYIMFVDADDWVEKDACENSLKGAYESNADIVFFGYSTNYTNREIRRVLDKVPEGLFERDSLELAILKGNPLLGPVEVGAPWGKLIRAKIIREKNIRYTPGLKKGQDTVFILNLIENCSSFVYRCYMGYHYRMLGSSISHRYNPEIVGIMEKTLEAYDLFVKKYSKNKTFADAVKAKYYKVLTGEFMMLDFCHPDNRTPEKEKIREFLKLIKKEPYSGIIGRIQLTGSYQCIQLCLIRKRQIRLLFCVKRLEIAARNFVIHQYGK